MNTRVAVTGMGILTPIGIGVEPFWKAALAGSSGVGPVRNFDASGLPAISYRDDANTRLKYARCYAEPCTTGSNWSVETVDSSADVGGYSSLKLMGGTATQWPAISYFDATNGALKFSYFNPATGWVTAMVDSATGAGVGKYTSLNLSPTSPVDVLLITYYDELNGNLKLAYDPGTGWQLVDFNASTNDVGKYGSSAIVSVGSAATQVALFTSYYDATAGALMYARWVTMAPEVFVVDTGNVGQFTSIAMMSNGSTSSPGISYYDAANGKLKFANWNGTSWTITPVSSLLGEPAGNNVGQYSALVLDPFWRIRISYYDSTNKNLRIGVQP